MIYVGIDPGPTETAVVWFDSKTDKIVCRYLGPNEEVRGLLTANSTLDASYNCEMIASYGMAVGKSVFETCLFIGELKEFCKSLLFNPLNLIYRKDIKMAFCGTCRAKDKNIRQYLIDRFPASGGGKIPQIGTKAKPGPLFGISQDLWSALAVSVYAADLDK